MRRWLRLLARETAVRLRRPRRSTVLDVVGVVAITVGIALIYLPAGVIFAGVAALLVSYVTE